MGIEQAKSLWTSSPEEADEFEFPIGKALTNAAQKHGDLEYVVYACHEDRENVRWTYSELNQKAEQLAVALLHIGYRPGDKVAVWGPNHAQWILLEFALAKAGLTLVALNPLYKKQELIFALNTVDAKGIFFADLIRGAAVSDVISQIQPYVPSLTKKHSFTDGIDDLFKLNVPVNRETLDKVAADAVQMIQFTSGTTGTPKTPQLSHKAIATTGRNAFKAYGFGENDRVCFGFPLFHIGGSGIGVVGTVMSGATLLPILVFNARRTLDILEQEKCTGFVGVPAMLIAMLEDETFKSRDLSPLRYISVGGAPVPTELVLRCEDAFQAEIANGYGQTECSGMISCIRSRDTTEQKSSTCGKALPGVSLKVTDEAGNIVSLGQQGELCYRGPGRMLGYLGLEDDTTIDDEGWLHTGDLATMDADGYITLVGRLKDIIIRGGENISPAEIENFLLRHPDVAEASVFGIPDKKYGEIVCAAIRTNNTNHASPEEIKEWCGENISLWKVPQHISFVDEFPVTPSGKIQKFVLRDQLVSSLNSR